MSRFAHLELPGDPDPNPGAESAQVFADGGPPHLQRARAARDRGDFHAALRHYARAVEADPSQDEGWAGQVWMLLEMDDLEAAKDWAERALSVLPESPRLLGAKARVLARLGLHEEALALSDGCIEAAEPDAEAWLSRAEVLLARGEPNANYCLEKCLALAGAEEASLAWRAARTLTVHGRHAAALDLLQRSVTRAPQQPAVWYDLALCRARLGCLEDARDACRQALSLDPAFAQARTTLGQLSTPGLAARIRACWRRLLGS